MLNPLERINIVSRLQIITAMIAFGSIGVFVRFIPLSSAEIAFWRGVIAFIVLSFVMIKTNRLSNLSKCKKMIGRLVFSGVAMGFNWLLLFEAYRFTTVALATLSYYFAPTIMIIGSVILFKENLDKKQIICFLISTTGLVMIIGVVGGGSNDLIGVLYGLAAAVLYALVVLTNKATSEVDGLTRTWIQFAAASVVLLPYTYLNGGFHFAQLEMPALVNLLIIGVVHTGIMYYFYFSALAHLKGQQAAILSYIDPIVAVFLSVTILNETITLPQLIGGFLILGATLINELKQKSKKIKTK